MDLNNYLKMSKKESQFSSFWDNSSDSYDVDEFLGNDVEKKKGKDIVALSGYKRAISNFVNIVTGESIPVTFNSNDASYTDGKTVTIGSNLNDEKFDVAVGLALHEASHIKLSDFDFFRNLEYEIPAETYTLGEGKGVPKYEVLNTIKSLLNYVEDRRIDNFVFTTSPGYKGYYHSMYDKYFYSKVIDKGLLSSEYRIENIQSYMFRIINLHNKNRQLGALIGLKEIYSLINLRNISRLNSTKDVFNIALSVMNVILNSIDNVVTENSNDENSEDASSIDGSGGGDENSDEGDDENSNGGGTGNDDGSEPVELTDNQKRQLETAMNKQEKFLDGDIKKGKLSKKDNNSVNAIDESGASYEQVGAGVDTDHNGSPIGNGTKCLVVKKLTQSLIDSEMFNCATKVNQSYYNNGSWNNYNFVEEGLRLGSILGKKLKIRGEETSLKYSRKDSGRLDKRLIAELGFGNSNVFSQTFIEKYNKAYLHISVDASGSMSGTKWNKAMTSAVAMIKAADMAGNIDVVVSIRTTHGNGYGRANRLNVPMIMVCYDSRVDKLIKIKSLFPALDVTGTTPEGLCFEAIMDDLIPGNSNQDSYFINYSDGGPWYNNSEISYSGRFASKHTRKMVNEMRNRGLKIMSYFIGKDAHELRCSERIFKEMYGADASFINSTNMMEVSKTMNKKFLSK